MTNKNLTRRLLTVVDDSIFGSRQDSICCAELRAVSYFGGGVRRVKLSLLYSRFPYAIET